MMMTSRLIFFLLLLNTSIQNTFAVVVLCPHIEDLNFKISPDAIKQHRIGQGLFDCNEKDKHTKEAEEVVDETETTLKPPRYLSPNTLKSTLLLSMLLFSDFFIQTPTILAFIVPKIEEENYQLLPITDKMYNLRIVLPNGSERKEFVELKSSGKLVDELSISGTIRTIYSDDNKILEVTYTADKNGYIASYKYGGFISAMSAAAGIGIRTLSPNALKTAAG